MLYLAGDHANTISFPHVHHNSIAESDLPFKVATVGAESKLVGADPKLQCD
jgi:hypothetical protein